MKGIVFALLFLVCAQSAPAQDDTDDNFCGSRSSRFDGKFFTFDLLVSDMEKAPAWKEEADFPPLPPRKARDLAFAQAQKLCPDVKQWELDRISLQEIRQPGSGHPTFWIYLVECEDFDGPYSGPPRILEIPVLMNGMIPEPHIRPW